jgi:hypothetical protein
MTWWASRLGNFTALSSKDGQYRAERPVMYPPYRAENFRFSLTMAWVSGLV